ncbi:hypothetical protein [Bradyrhizobium archetypum]|uniref:Uncharacterized protein n=1 Tax=Bradyrhizobium archetypum TaxID=2721160 RepID=A0A7Y4H2F6_9BRAD|nr:hypothetical protein [Bradyrhizobium archetypum]NOJ46069.1 hypothetical protein [Bradyrhizobium archetypum]
MTRMGFLAAALVTVSAATAQAEDDRCKNILANGIWEYSFGQSDVQNVSAFLNWYKSTNSGSNSLSKKQTLDSGIVYDGAPVKLGLSNDRQQNDQFFSQLDTLNSGYKQYDSSVINFVKTASPVIAKAWADCMNAQGGGIHASLKFTGDPRDLLLSLAFQPIDQTQKAKVTLGAGQGLQCKVGNDQTVSVPSNVTTVVRCTRSNGSAGTILLTSKTKIIPDNSLPYSAIRFPLSGPYGTCAVVEEIKNGQDTLGPPESISTGGTDISGGGPKSALLHLEAPDGYKLGNVQKHCQKNAGDNPCAFVIPTAEAPWSWTIQDKSMDWNPSNNSDSATVWVTGSKAKIIAGFERRSNGSVALAYGKAFSVEFPNVALDVKLLCQADGSSRIYSLSDMATKGEQVYLSGIRQNSTGRIYDLVVAPYDVGP